MPSLSGTDLSTDETAHFAQGPEEALLVGALLEGRLSSAWRTTTIPGVVCAQRLWEETDMRDEIDQKTRPMNGADSVVRTLVDAGVEVCFANPGTSEIHFVASLDRESGLRPDPVPVRGRRDRRRRRLRAHGGETGH